MGEVTCGEAVGEVTCGEAVGKVTCGEAVGEVTWLLPPPPAATWSEDLEKR